LVGILGFRDVLISTLSDIGQMSYVA